MASLPIDNGSMENEPGFKTFSKSLRDVSDDKTPLPNSFVSFYSDVYDMLSSDEGKTSDDAIVGVEYNKEKNTIIFIKKNGETISIGVKDNFLSGATYDNSTDEITFTLTDGQEVSLNTTTLEQKFYTKSEIDEKIQNSKPIWGEF